MPTGLSPSSNHILVLLLRLVLRLALLLLLLIQGRGQVGLGHTMDTGGYTRDTKESQQGYARRYAHGYAKDTRGTFEDTSRDTNLLGSLISLGSLGGLPTLRH